MRQTRDDDASRRSGALEFVAGRKTPHVLIPLPLIVRLAHPGVDNCRRAKRS